MTRREYREIGDRSRFDEMMAPGASLKGMWLAAKPDDPDPFGGRITLYVGLSANPAPMPGGPRRMPGRTPLESMVVDYVLGSRSLARIERATAVLDDYIRSVPGAAERLSWLGEFIARMGGALRIMEGDE